MKLFISWLVRISRIRPESSSANLGANPTILSEGGTENYKGVLTIAWSRGPGPTKANRPRQKQYNQVQVCLDKPDRISQIHHKPDKNSGTNPTGQYSKVFCNPEFLQAGHTCGSWLLQFIRTHNPHEVNSTKWDRYNNTQALTMEIYTAKPCIPTLSISLSLWYPHTFSIDTNCINNN